ncbi:putative MFS family arabinose efflux permease [Streptomyces sp. PanSC19]|uniref:MFS transporter n=1 Tax=Streptomyces sp. PanSC19 TaxID=1520455 RepID=UPI000FAC6D8B|nr:MFS transporter [Streptomyces sp. PanSC19]ROQ27079.1 putative MFS family arabinose efflux permease [Streptomyces sp. PanSC19]
MNDGPAVKEQGRERAAGESLWRHRDFMALWTGQIASAFGWQIAQVALPLVAVTTLDTGGTELGLLRSLQQAPVLLFALFVGVWVDRWRVRSMMALSDLGRAVLLAALPVAYLLDLLSLPLLFVAAFAVGVFTVCFDVAYQSALPRLVDRGRLAQGNGMLEGSRSASQIGGPALGGGIVSLLSAPLALFGSGVFFLLSAFSIRRIGRVETPPPRSEESAGMWRQIREGFQLIIDEAPLRAVAVSSAAFQFFYAGLMTMYLLFLPRTLHLSGAEVGLVLAALGPGALVGSFLAAVLPRRFGYGVVLMSTAVIADGALLLVPFLRGSSAATVVALMAINFVFAAFAQTVDVTVTTVRLAITPADIQGRVVATINFVGMGLSPVGALLGGVLGGVVGLRTGLLVAAVGLLLSPLCMLLSPLARVGKALPEPRAEG